MNTDYNELDLIETQHGKLYIYIGFFEEFSFYRKRMPGQEDVVTTAPGEDAEYLINVRHINKHIYLPATNIHDNEFNNRKEFRSSLSLGVVNCIENAIKANNKDYLNRLASPVKRHAIKIKRVDDDDIQYYDFDYYGGVYTGPKIYKEYHLNWYWKSTEKASGLSDNEAWDMEYKAGLRTDARPVQPPKIKKQSFYPYDYRCRIDGGKVQTLEALIGKFGAGLGRKLILSALEDFELRCNDGHEVGGGIWKYPQYGVEIYKKSYCIANGMLLDYNKDRFTDPDPYDTPKGYKHYTVGDLIKDEHGDLYIYLGYSDLGIKFWKDRIKNTDGSDILDRRKWLDIGRDEHYMFYYCNYAYDHHIYLPIDNKNKLSHFRDIYRDLRYAVLREIEDHVRTLGTWQNGEFARNKKWIYKIATEDKRKAVEVIKRKDLKIPFTLDFNEGVLDLRHRGEANKYDISLFWIVDLKKTGLKPIHNDNSK